MAKRKQFITDEQWQKLEPLLPAHTQSPKGGRSHGAIERFSKVSSGSCEAVRDGTICRIGIHQPAHAGDDYSFGKSKASGSRSGVSSYQNWTNRANWTGKKPLLTAVLPRQKKGPMCRKDQTWKRYKVDGGGGWPGSPSRCSSRFGLAE